MAPFYSCTPVGHDSVSGRQRAQHQDIETKAAEWNSPITYFIYTFFLLLIYMVLCNKQ